MSKRQSLEHRWSPGQFQSGLVQSAIGGTSHGHSRGADILLNRRRWLQGVAAAGLTLWVPGLDLRAAETRGPERPRSLITIFLSGGPSQLETWDPHPGTKCGGPTTAIDTSIPGTQIGSEYPQVAEQLRHLSVVRSLVSKEGDHERGTYMVKTGYRPEPTVVHPTLGAIAAYALPDPRVEIPLYITLGSEGHPSRAGYLGSHLDPFRIPDPGNPGDNVNPPVEADRQQRRIAGLDVVSKAFAKGRSSRVDKTLHQHTVSAALTMMRSEQLKALDVSSEPAELRARYGDHPFGKGCLVARRLLEQGVRSIEVGLDGFDSHAENFSIHSARAKVLDPALATLIQDLRDRDLWQSTVLLVIGEFGRTPQINPLNGRDHWPNGFSCLVGGAGFAPGRVIGATDPEGLAKLPERPITVADLSATVLQQVGVDYAHEVMTPIGRPIKYCEGQPVSDLLA